jgi:hypothetical protein
MSGGHGASAPLPTLRLRELELIFREAPRNLCLLSFQKYLFISKAPAVFDATHLNRI